MVSSPRELEVSRHMVAGRRNKQIAADLGTGEKTIKVHRSNVMKKMEASSLPDLVRMAPKAERAGGGYTAGRGAECSFETAIKAKIGSIDCETSANCGHTMKGAVAIKSRDVADESRSLHRTKQHVDGPARPSTPSTLAGGGRPDAKYCRSFREPMTWEVQFGHQDYSSRS